MESLLPPITKEERHLIENHAPEYLLMYRHDTYWRLYLDPEQRVFGQAYLWFRYHDQNADFRSLANLHDGERFELFQLFGRYERVLQRNWGALYLSARWGAEEYEDAKPHRGHACMHLLPVYPEGSKIVSTVEPSVTAAKIRVDLLADA